MIKKHLHKAFSFLLALLLAAGLAVPLVGCTEEDALDLLTAVVENRPEETAPASSVIYGEAYTDPYDVADYLHAYGELPPNFITKNEAKELGWDSAKGNLWDVAPGMSIGGDRFGNREGLLPKADGRTWYECDVNYEGGYRGADRVLYSSDGLIYCTFDHYESFTAIYE